MSNGRRSDPGPTIQQDVVVLGSDLSVANSFDWFVHGCSEAVKRVGCSWLAVHVGSACRSCSARSACVQGLVTHSRPLMSHDGAQSMACVCVILPVHVL